jgi:hypothetical protein
MGYPHPFSTTIKKQGLLLTPLQILQSSKFNVHSSDNLCLKNTAKLKHNHCQTRFMGEIWQHSTTIEHELVQLLSWYG